MRLAVKTLEAIEAEFVRTQGGTYREALGKIILDSPDAYRPQETSPRSHMGCSMLGEACERKLFYNFRFVKEPRFNGSSIRIFNLGHISELFMIAMLQSIGCQVTQIDENGKQMRVAHGLFIGGSSDCTATGIPDLPDEKVLLEFKTSNKKSFEKLQAKGVKSEKFVHFVQQQLYMHKMRLSYSLYIVYCKDNSELHAEIIEYDALVATHYFERADSIVNSRHPPKRISNNPDVFACRYCDFREICFFNEQCETTCRSCKYSTPNPQHGWVCELHQAKLSTERQLSACDSYACCI
jgi:CRISPR/Cas system-associated exonuclease Cas4 (RecB family)